MRKSNKSAADRTLELVPGVLKEQDNHAPPIVKPSGLEVTRVDLMTNGNRYLSPAYHYASGSHTLCGLKVSDYKDCEKGLPLGVYASCRVEASIQRATVRT